MSLGNRAELALQIVAPGVVRADEPLRVALRLGQQCGTAMAADVAEGAHLSIAGAADDHRQAQLLEQLVVARIRDLADMTDVQPHLPEQMLLLKRVEFGVRIPPGRHGRKRRKLLGIGGATDLRIHRPGNDLA